MEYYERRVVFWAIIMYYPIGFGFYYISNYTTGYKKIYHLKDFMRRYFRKRANMDVSINSGISILDPQVLVMTICTGASAGMLLSLMRFSVPFEIFPVVFIIVPSMMIFMESSWLFFWYKPNLHPLN